MPDPLPRIRDDLKITPIDEGGQKSYIIEDPLRNTYYKIGLRLSFSLPSESVEKSG